MSLERTDETQFAPQLVCSTVRCKDTSARPSARSGERLLPRRRPHRDHTSHGADQPHHPQQFAHALSCHRARMASAEHAAAQAEAAKLFRIRKTLSKMLLKRCARVPVLAVNLCQTASLDSRRGCSDCDARLCRGYNVLDEEVDMTMEVFMEKVRSRPTAGANVPVASRRVDSCSSAPSFLCPIVQFAPGGVVSRIAIMQLVRPAGHQTPRPGAAPVLLHSSLRPVDQICRACAGCEAGRPNRQAPHFFP